MKKRNKRSLFSVPAVLLALSVVLLLSSVVGSARATLTYNLDNREVQMDISVSSIGVTLNENGEAVSSRDYEGNVWVGSSNGELLTKMLGEGEKFAPGKAYPEALSVTNSGKIDSYVRVILRKSWIDPEKKTDTNLSPELIDLKLLTDNGWIVDENASTRERTVLYYTRILHGPAEGEKVGETTPALSDTLKVDNSILKERSRTVVSESGGTQVIKTEYLYNGYSFSLEAEADAVQTHNAVDAIKSAWGVDVKIDPLNGNLSLVQ